MGKVRVADVILPVKGLSKSEWQIAFNKISSKHFDFILCQKHDLSVVSAIELDDKSHKSETAQKRDLLLNTACESAKFPLVRFPAKNGYRLQEVKDKIISRLTICNDEMT